MSATFAPPLPPAPAGRPQELSPASIGSGSEWSGMNNYNSGTRPDGNYNGHMGYPRNDADTPPDSASYNGPPPRHFQPSGRDGPPRPRRPSESGSQQSSRTGSVANSRSSDGTISDQQSRRYRKMEYELSQHYTVLKNFLKGGAAQPPRPNKARDKLLRLSPGQFHELSTDVFDELQRRQATAPLPGRRSRGDNVPPFLQPRSEFHEKRNQARQKLSSLQTARFRDLSTDVFCELERRFPYFAMPDGQRRDSSRSVSSRGGRGPPPPRVNTANLPPPNSNQFPPRNGSMTSRGDVPQFDNPPVSASSAGTGDFGRPIPKQFQSNTITPNKSTMVDDDEDEDGPGLERSNESFARRDSITSPMSDHDTPATSVTNHSRDMKSLQDKISDLESNLREKDDDMSSLRDELEQKVQQAEKLHRSLQDEIEKLHNDHADRERDLQAQLNAAKRDSEDGGLWKTKHDQLQRDHDDLQLQYEEQRRITDEVSQQGEAFLREMRAMAEEQLDMDFEREEKLALEVNRLQKELLDWKNRHANTKDKSSNDKAVLTGGIKSVKLEDDPQQKSFWHADGMIKDMHITQFQIAIDELLQAARTQNPKNVMDLVKPVAIAVRDIALDIDTTSGAGPKDEESIQRRLKLKERVSATANNIITACKNHAAAGGLSPVSLLDAAASHLSAAVVELARMVKVRSTSAVDLEEESKNKDGVAPAPDGTPEPMNDAGYFTMSQRLRNESPVNSIYSVLSTPEDESRDSASSAAEHQASRGADGDKDGPGSTGLGIQAGLKMKEDDTELQELKIYLENQTDLLVQDIQALVSSIRHEDHMAEIQGHINAILDVVENVLSATEGAMDDQSWFQGMLKQRATPAVNILALSKDKLLDAANDPQAQVDGPATKEFTQKLPPLAFRLARDTKDLVSRIETVEAGQQEGDEDDFS